MEANFSIVFNEKNCLGVQFIFIDFAQKFYFYSYILLCVPSELFFLVIDLKGGHRKILLQQAFVFFIINDLQTGLRKILLQQTFVFVTLLKNCAHFFLLVPIVIDLQHQCNILLHKNLILILTYIYIYHLFGDFNIKSEAFSISSAFTIAFDPYQASCCRRQKVICL